jgi:hypothetical protein
MRSLMQLVALASALFVAACALPGCTSEEGAGGKMDGGAMDKGKMGGAMDKGKMEGGAMDKGKMDSPPK